MLDEHDKILLSQFIGENWASFLAFCDEQGISEADAEELANKLDNK
jgi:hypothetical protein